MENKKIIYALAILIIVFLIVIAIIYIIPNKSVTTPNNNNNNNTDWCVKSQVMNIRINGNETQYTANTITTYQGQVFCYVSKIGSNEGYYVNKDSSKIYKVEVNQAAKAIQLVPV
jgi:hypothetical protein